MSAKNLRICAKNYLLVQILLFAVICFKNLFCKQSLPKFSKHKKLLHCKLIRLFNIHFVYFLNIKYVLLFYQFTVSPQLLKPIDNDSRVRDLVSVQEPKEIIFLNVSCQLDDDLKVCLFLNHLRVCTLHQQYQKHFLLF